MTGWPLPCTCPMALEYCDLDRPRCPRFHDATYVEIEAGLYELFRGMMDDLDMWRQVRAAENEPPLDEGDARMMEDA